MKRLQHRGLVVLLLLGLLLCRGMVLSSWAAELEPEQPQTFSDAAETENGELEEDNTEEDTPENIVASCEELGQWFEANEGIGGTVYLGCSIEIDSYLCPLTSAEAPITINTGSYSLIFAGDCIENGYGFLEIIGEGVSAPVVEVRDMDWLPMGDWIFHLLNLCITATGKDGVGGTALLISAIDEQNYNIALTPSIGQIRSFGENAIGIELAVPMEAYLFQVTVEGAGSRAIYAHEGATVFYARLTAHGEGAEVAATRSDNRVVLENCIISPEPSASLSAEVITLQRHLLETMIYYPTPQNAELSRYDLFNYRFATLQLSGAEGLPETRRPFATNWDLDAFLHIDTGITGSTAIPGTLDPWLQDFGLIRDFSPELTVEVRDPRLPCIKEAFIDRDAANDELYINLFFWDSYDPREDGAGGMVDYLGRKIILWCSNDLGEFWTDVSTAAETRWQSDSVQYYFGDASAPIQLQIEVVGVGESNVATVFIADGEVCGGLSGDRTGSDRNVGMAGNPNGGGVDNENNGDIDSGSGESDTNANTDNGTGGKDNTGADSNNDNPADEKADNGSGSDLNSETPPSLPSHGTGSGRYNPPVNPPAPPPDTTVSTIATPQAESKAESVPDELPTMLELSAAESLTTSAPIEPSQAQLSSEVSFASVKIPPGNSISVAQHSETTPKNLAEPVDLPIPLATSGGNHSMSESSSAVPSSAEEPSQESRGETTDTINPETEEAPTDAAPAPLLAASIPQPPAGLATTAATPASTPALSSTQRIAEAIVTPQQLQTAPTLPQNNIATLTAAAAWVTLLLGGGYVGIRLFLRRRP